MDFIPGERPREALSPLWRLNQVKNGSGKVGNGDREAAPADKGSPQPSLLPGGMRAGWDGNHCMAPGNGFSLP